MRRIDLERQAVGQYKVDGDRAWDGGGSSSWLWFVRAMSRNVAHPASGIRDHGS